MKKCPTCDKTFEDSMRFCQIDGTPLVDDAPAFDPYATIIGGAGMADAKKAAPSDAAPVDPLTGSPNDEAAGSGPISAPTDEVLDLPEADPLKTIYASNDEMSAALDTSTESDSGIVELDPIGDTPQPTPPSFSAPDVPSPSFGTASPPPSPFSDGKPDESPYSDPMPAPPFFEEPSQPKRFDEAETMIAPSFGSPSSYDPTPPVAEWTPPPAPESSWENQQIGATTPFQAPMANLTGDNKTLAIVSLVLGILGLTICCGTILPSIAALVTGFMARSKSMQNPNEYGGQGLAMAGIITGALGLVGSVIVLIFWLLGTFASVVGNM
ncbi:MAG: DUF4190 domain-containing protein [Pyrinomonadaceae bacterium]